MSGGALGRALRHGAAALALGIACAPPPLVPVPPVGRVTRVDVQLGEGGASAPAVTDSARLARLAAFVDERRHGWRPDARALGPGGIHARLWRDDALVAVVSLREGELWRTGGDAPPLSQPLPPEDAEAFTRLLGAPTPPPSPSP